MVDRDPLLLYLISGLGVEFWFCVKFEDKRAIEAQWAMQPAFDIFLAKSQFARLQNGNKMPFQAAFPGKLSLG